MTQAQQAAHERLQALLPVKTVGEPSQTIQRKEKEKKRNGNELRRRPLVFLGREYPSIIEAHIRTGCSTSLIWRYAKERTRNSRFLQRKISQ